MVRYNREVPEKFKFVISDCHLSAGRFYEGRLNPHEDFHFDEEMVRLFEHFSQGRYGSGPDGPVDVELVIAGDFFDFLNVPLDGEFDDAVTEQIALKKLEAIIAGHPLVMAAIRKFASLPSKRVTYLIGNHDADLFFDAVRERITREWDPEGRAISDKVTLIADRDRIIVEGGVEIHHGNQWEPGSLLNFDRPVISGTLSSPVLNLPWSSFYVLKIVNRLKIEREHIDKVRPVKVFILLGLVADTIFTLKFCFLTAFYFIQTRLIPSPYRRSRFSLTLEMLKPELRLFLDLEREARQYLDENANVTTLICGHTHLPVNKVYPDGKQYINTGTWTRMINMDWKRWGAQPSRTFALIQIKDGKAFCDLRYWVGEHSPHKAFEAQ
jgi:UDP-2,3-diacylglucosamine pyrophosphatase LpxH